MTEETLFEFPCDFPIKVMGRADAGLEALVIEILQRHAPDFDPATLAVRDSRQRNYLALTATIRATSREQLDNIYLELTACEQVLMAL